MVVFPWNTWRSVRGHTFLCLKDMRSGVNEPQGSVFDYFTAILIRTGKLESEIHLSGLFHKFFISRCENPPLSSISRW